MNTTTLQSRSVTTLIEAFLKDKSKIVTSPTHVAGTKDDQYPSLTDNYFTNMDSLDINWMTGFSIIPVTENEIAGIDAEWFFDEDGNSNLYTRKIMFYPDHDDSGDPAKSIIERYELIDNTNDCAVAYATFVGGELYQTGYNPDCLNELILAYWYVEEVYPDRTGF